MNPLLRPVLLTTLSILAASALIPVASADTGCPDPHHGPFDPCLWNCSPGWEPECELILGAGHTVWHYYCDRVTGTC